mmetsp:Transcript_65138/g.153821  ORF Transcript_65138/g.153821 Transcript_65138/m.153821 type:complete len:286 (-) Transcript_65138:1932-2789(-)
MYHDPWVGCARVREEGVEYEKEDPVLCLFVALEALVHRQMTQPGGEMIVHLPLSLRRPSVRGECNAQQLEVPRLEARCERGPRQSFVVGLVLVPAVPQQLLHRRRRLLPRGVKTRVRLELVFQLHFLQGWDGHTRGLGEFVALLQLLLHSHKRLVPRPRKQLLLLGHHAAALHGCLHLDHARKRQGKILRLKGRQQGFHQRPPGPECQASGRALSGRALGAGGALCDGRTQRHHLLAVALGVVEIRPEVVEVIVLHVLEHHLGLTRVELRDGLVQRVLQPVAVLL